MGLSYYIYLITFLGFPIIALILSKLKWIKISRRILIILIGIFLFHNVLFLIGLSILGDYPDYIVFSFEYLFFCYLVSRLKRDKFTNVEFAFKIFGNIVIVLGFLQALLGILLFIVISQDYDSDGQFRFEDGCSKYETRRYSFGFVTLEDTRYTLETYRTFRYLPFEYKVDKSDFFSSKCNVNFSDSTLKIAIIGVGDKKRIKFSSKEGQIFKDI